MNIKKCLSAKYLFFVFACSIFFSETLIMLFLDKLPAMLKLDEALFDASLLIFLNFPALYFLAFLPQKRLNENLIEAKEFLSHQNEELEVESYIKRNQAFESKLRHEQLLYVIDQLAIFSITDSLGNISYVNQRFCEISGYSEEELLGKNHRLVKSNYHTFDFYKELWGTITSGNVWFGTICNCAKDGSLYWVQATIVPFMDEHNTIERYISMRIDVTKQKELEIEALKSAQIKSDFLSTMSHEIRTPMSAIIGMTHLLSKTPLNTIQDNYLHKIQSSSQHLLNIINDILDLSKIESGNVLIEAIDFRIDSVLQNIKTLISDKIYDKGLKLIFNIDDRLPIHVNGDPLRLGQVLINYANNALKFTEKGTITISIKIIEESEIELVLHFSVTDTGIGLSKQATSKLFQSFQQADMSTSRKYGGTGLGLSISKQLVGLMHGEVGVESEVGEGSSFWFTVPLKKTNNLIAHITAIKELTGRKVLIIGGDQISRHFLGNILASFGLDVTKTSTAEKGLKYCKASVVENTIYEIIFVNWSISYEVNFSKIINEIQNTSSHIVVISANGREEVIQNIRKTGIENILLEPLSPSFLFNITMRLLGEKFDELDYESQSVNTHTSQAFTHSLLSIAGASILLVEDIELNQEIANSLLTQEGFYVDIAQNGFDALVMLELKYYDLVLMDMQMPVMDGISATIEIRKNPQFNDLPVIAMTANVMQHDKEKCLTAGMNDFVTKPIDLEALFSVLLKWIPSKDNKRDVVNNVNPIEMSDNIDIPFIEGIDVESGLKRILGRKKFYVTMLNNYANSQFDTAYRIRDALNQDDYATAERIAHSTKGLSGNIAATQLQTLSSELEAMISGKKSLIEIEEKLVQFEITQSALLVAIKEAKLSIAPNIIQKLEINDIDISQATLVFAQLKELLNEQDHAAVKFFDQYSTLLEAALGTELFVLIRRDIKQYDFDKAVERLTSIK